MFWINYWYAIGILFGIAGIGIWYISWVKKRQKLAKGVLSLGNLVGKHYNEFKVAMGSPVDVDKRIAQNTQTWVKVATWQAGGYQIIIMFDENDIFDHIVSESRYDKI